MDDLSTIARRAAADQARQDTERQERNTAALLAEWRERAALYAGEVLERRILAYTDLEPLDPPGSIYPRLGFTIDGLAFVLEDAGPNFDRAPDEPARWTSLRVKLGTRVPGITSLAELGRLLEELTPTEPHPKDVAAELEAVAVHESEEDDESRRRLEAATD